MSAERIGRPLAATVVRAGELRALTLTPAELPR
jgi:hypothetical protein